MVFISNYIVIARFDEQTNSKFFHLHEEFKSCGFSEPEYPPHMTIAAYENFNEELLCDWTSSFSKSHSKFNIRLDSLSVLPSVGEHKDSAFLCLAPSHSKVLVDFYYEFHSRYEEYCTGIGYYNSISHGNPVIHATIEKIKISELQSAMNIVFTSNIFGMAEVNALEIYTYPTKLIKRYELE